MSSDYGPNMITTFAKLITHCPECGTEMVDHTTQRQTEHYDEKAKAFRYVEETVRSCPNQDTTPWLACVRNVPFTKDGTEQETAAG